MNISRLERRFYANALYVDAALVFFAVKLGEHVAAALLGVHALLCLVVVIGHSFIKEEPGTLE